MRVEGVRESDARVRDRQLEGAAERDDVGLSVRVLSDGTWGFAATTDLSSDAAAPAADVALEVARTAASLRRERIDLAGEAVYPEGTWVSTYEVNPFDVPAADRAAQ